MKLTRLSLLAAALTWASGAFAAPIPADLAGSYQALLYSGEGDTSSPNALVALTLTSKGALSGKLTGQDNKTYAFKTKTALDYTATLAPEGNDPLGTATSEVIEIKRPKMDSLFLTLHFKDFADSDVVEVSLKEGEADLASSDEGFKQITFAKGAAGYDAAGVYSTVFEPVASDANEPSGSGYAVSTIDSKGVLKFVGKTADGVAFTTSCPSGPDHQFVVFLNPHKRVNSMLAGKIKLSSFGEDEQFHMLPAEVGYDFKWTKSSLLPKTTDKSYREGFDLNLKVTIEPWLVLAKGETLAAALGAENLQFGFEISGASLNFSADYPGMFPTKLTIDAKNNLVPLFGDVFAPVDSKEWAKIWSAKVDPKTGVYKGTLTITDLVTSSGLIDDSVLDGADPHNPPVATPAKFVKRKITFEGVLLASGEAGRLAARGFFLIPPLDAKASTIKAGKADVGGVLEALYTGAPDYDEIRPGTAGTYTTTLVSEIKPLDFSMLAGGMDGFSIGAVPPMKNLPGLGSTVTFSIAPDLSSMTFNGRKIPLIGDQRKFNFALVFSDAKSTKIKDTLTVVVYLDLVTGQVSGLGAMYLQLLSTSITFPTMSVPGYGTVRGRTVRGFVPGVAWYVENSVPDKIQ